MFISNRINHIQEIIRDHHRLKPSLDLSEQVWIRARSLDFPSCIIARPSLELVFPASPWGLLGLGLPSWPRNPHNINWGHWMKVDTKLRYRRSVTFRFFLYSRFSFVSACSNEVVLYCTLEYVSNTKTWSCWTRLGLESDDHQNTETRLNDDQLESPHCQSSQGSSRFSLPWKNTIYFRLRFFLILGTMNVENPCQHLLYTSC